MDTIETTIGEETVLVETEGEHKVMTSPTNAVESEEKPEESREETSEEEVSTESEKVEAETAEAEKVEAETAEEEAAPEEPQPQVEDVEEKEETEEVDEPELDEETETPAEEEAEQEDPNERDFDKNPTVLFALLQKKEWEAAIQRANDNCEEADVWVSRKEKDGRLRWRLLPIHAAIVFKAPEDVIEALLRAFPKGAETKDDQGMLPLHLSFRNASPAGTVKQLLAAYPQSIDIKDRKGRVPVVLAQASNSPHKEAYLHALAREREPSPQVVTAAATERAAVTAEQRAIFDAKLMQMKETHEHELAAVKLAAKNKEKEIRSKLEEMEQEFLKSQETSQILVDHVNSLEAQLNTRSDTERFLATKIATLDTSLKSTEKGREEVEYKLRLENHALIAERDGYKSKFDELEAAHDEAQTKLTESLQLFEKRESEWGQLEADLQQQIKTTQLDWANAQANCAILDAQLKKKMETEHSLASQVSTLAGKLAEHASDSRDSSSKYSSKVKDLEEERVVLRSTVQDLTKRLKLVARVLEDMTNEQSKIVSDSYTHEAAIAQALEAHAKIVADALEQQHSQEEARREREEMREILKKQEKSVAADDEKRAFILNAIVAQGEHMEKTQKARDSMLKTVNNMGNDCKLVLENIKSVLPSDEQDEKDLVDGVVAAVVNPSPEEAPKAEEEKKDEEVEAVDTLTEKALSHDDEHTASTEKTSKAETEDAPSSVPTLQDRIMAAREATA